MAFDDGDVGIIWDDSSVTLTRHSGASISTLNASIFSGRSVDKTSLVFTIQSDESNFYIVGFQRGAIMHSFINGNDNLSLVERRETFVGYYDGAEYYFEISKLGIVGTVTEIIASKNPLVLKQPPQSGAMPTVARQWDTFPKVNSQGQFLGASSREKSGTLQLNMKDLTLSWIEEYWEPFREHASRGGIFAYLSGGGLSNSNEIAYCYAARNVPAPKIEAGGFGSVSLTAGVANI